MLYITDELCDWYNEYLYVREFYSSQKYNEQSNRFIEAWMVYKRYRDKYDAEETEIRLKRSQEKIQVKR